MKELMRTNDAVLISFVSTLLSEADIDFMVADTNMSVMEGSLGVLPRRVLVAEDEMNKARRILEEAGVGDAIKDAGTS
ncbi:hypothetical protein A7A08_02021 [Methyloligella halotolerans]|uniref:DUF2007 domain-containing protein n=1 Tax=Methyloligella halotolerans TaxID=1177755 RepID=A0A1E2RYH6_9HYPH|nr:DUF2007 domain-containing protein [Methyloligella halotolerans]ODA67274.1 hypothetical protein A7A08_02021 [Methyloligella halotolerans]